MSAATNILREIRRANAAGELTAKQLLDIERSACVALSRKSAVKFGSIVFDGLSKYASAGSKVPTETLVRKTSKNFHDLFHSREEERPDFWNDAARIRLVEFAARQLNALAGRPLSLTEMYEQFSQAGTLWRVIDLAFPRQDYGKASAELAAYDPRARRSSDQSVGIPEQRVDSYFDGGLGNDSAEFYAEFYD